MPAEPDRIHATAIALPDAAVLIRGPSGSGKSDLALRCLATPPHPFWGPSPRLIADDQVILTQADGYLLAKSPPSILGKIEIRGVGILDFDPIEDIPVRLIVDLVRTETIERLPSPSGLVTLLGVDVPQLKIAPFEQSAPIKLLLTLARLARR